MNTTLKNYGLIPEKISRIHPTTHQVFGSVGRPEIAPLQLPDIVGPTNQGETSFCFAYCLRQLCSDQDNILYDENWNVIAASKVYGQSTLNGAPALSAMESMVEYGALAEIDAPEGMTWETKTPAFIADPSNWPLDELYLKAARHEKPAVLSVDGPYDAFDNIRSAIQMHRRHVALATKWLPAFNMAQGDGFIPSTLLPSIKDPTTPFTWHMYEAMDFDTIGGVDVIRVKPHESASYGKGGYAYLDRDTINFLDSDPLANAFMFADVPISIVRRLQIQSQSVEDIFAELAARIEQAL